MPGSIEIVSIIPAYNEMHTVGDVVDALGHDGPVYVVDDGSTDGTAEAARAATKILQHSRNLGKGMAIHSAYEEALADGAEIVRICDADLRGLTPAHGEQLVEPIIAGEAQMVLGVLDRPEWLQAYLLKQGWWTGQRGMELGVLGRVFQKYPQRTWEGFGIEPALNTLARHEGWHHIGIGRTALRGVTHIGKRGKTDTLLEAFLAYVDTYSQAGRTLVELEILQQLHRFSLIGSS